MARVNLESECLSDTRFVHLAQLLGMPDPDTARMKCARVWHECTLRGRPVLSASTIDAAAGIQGFSALMVEAELARTQRGEIYVCGTRGRIEWFQSRKENGKLGGKATRKAWQEKKQAHSQQLTEGHVPQGTGKAGARPSGSGSGSGSVSSGEELPGFALRASEPAGPTPGSQLKAAFLPWYLERYRTEYAWSAKEGKHAKDLVGRAGALGVPEVLRRATIAAEQDWRKTPVTLGALVEGWNGLSVEVVTDRRRDAKTADPALKAQLRANEAAARELGLTVDEGSSR